MTTEPTMTLREVAVRLAALSKMPAGKIAINKLSTLLKSGEFKTGFHVPGRIVSWITIPSSYWAKIGHDNLRSLLYSSDDETQTGSYKIRLPDFANEYHRAVQNELEKNKQNKTDRPTTLLELLEEFRVALSGASGRYEVLVPEREWVDYLTRHNLNEPAPKTKPKSGRHEKTGWRRVSVLMGAYLIHHYQTRPKNEIKLETASEEIYKVAVSDEIPDLPSAPTIKDALSEMFQKAKSSFR